MLKSSLALSAMVALMACAAAATTQSASITAPETYASAPAPVEASALPHPAAIAVGEPAPSDVERVSMRDSVNCQIRTANTRNGVRFDAVAHAGRPLEGEYEFIIAKDGAGGSSDIVQSGPFELASGDSATIGSAELGADRGHYRATLVIRDEDGELCHRTVRS